MLVLGLAVWSLEVARAALDPSSYPGAVLAAAEDPDDDTETGFIRETTLRPSEFLDEDAVSSEEEEDDVLYVAPGVGDNILGVFRQFLSLHITSRALPSSGRRQSTSHEVHDVGPSKTPEARSGIDENGALEALVARRPDSELPPSVLILNVTSLS